jgi:hypothetical protein
MKNTYSPCGIDCNSCDAFIATQTNDLELFEKLAEQFKVNQGFEIEPEKLRCNGCMNEGVHIGFCDECGIRACAIEKGYQNCADCDLLPCEKGSFIWTEGSASLANLRSIRRVRS